MPQPKDSDIRPDRYECYLYLQIPSRLNGQLTLPNITKYRSLEAGLVSRAHEYDLLAILVANATNQGVYGISQLSDRAYDQLSTIQSNYIRLETLNEAIDTVNNATARLPIFKYYNFHDDIIHGYIDDASLRNYVQRALSKNTT